MSDKHFWGRPLELDGDRFRHLVEDARRLRVGLGVPILGVFGGVRIGGALGTGSPIFGSDTICFNGRPGHESFLILRSFQHPDQETGSDGLHWDGIATAGKPYDTLVVAVLLSFKHHFPEAALYSDGGEREWAAGVALYRKVTGREVPSFSELATPHPAQLSV